ncbi:unnamed protein product [Closterium sp. NIES-64]|nr:unnamed protein product [Closterium sp. NIES-64]
MFRCQQGAAFNHWVQVGGGGVRCNKSACYLSGSGESGEELEMQAGCHIQPLQSCESHLAIPVRELPFAKGNVTAHLERLFRFKQGAAYNHWLQHYASEVHWAFHTDIDNLSLLPHQRSPLSFLPLALPFPSSSQHYASEVHWAFHTDIDEYFFSPAGTPPGFLRHYLQKLPNTTVQVGGFRCCWLQHHQVHIFSAYVGSAPEHVLVQNMFFLGDPIGSDTNTLLEHYTHRMPTSSGRLRTKPIAWLPLAVHLSGDVFISPHQWPMMENGRPPLVDTGVLRLNHYWGDRAGVISDNTPDYRIDVTMMSEYGDGLVKDESAKVRDELAQGRDELAKVRDELAKVRDELAKVRDELAKVKDELGKVMDELAKPMGVWLRQRMQVAWAVISAQAVHKERKRLRKRVAEVKTRVRQLEALVPQLLNEGGGKGVRREGNERDMEEEWG